MRLFKCGLAAFVLSCAIACQAEDYGATARGMFALLPPSIFESTAAGLDEMGKQALLHNGASQFWEITGETPDVLIFSERPFRDRSVALRLFRNDSDGSAEVAIGTLGETFCTVELWRADASGRIVPVDTPPEPAIGEFFSSRRKPAVSQQNSVLICLGAGGLLAKPIFWSEEGFMEPAVDNEISFQWTGSGFEKETRRLPARQRLPR